MSINDRTMHNGQGIHDSRLLEMDVAAIKETIQMLPVKTLTRHAKNSCTVAVVIPYFTLLVYISMTCEDVFSHLLRGLSGANSK